MSAPETPRAAQVSDQVGRGLGLTPQTAAGLQGRHVLVVGIDYEPDTTGIAPYTTGLAAHLAGSAASVTVLTGVPRHPDDSVPAAYRRGLRFADPGWCLPEGPRVIRLWHYVPRRWGALRRGMSELSFLLNAIASSRLASPDVVIGVTPSPSGAAAAAWLAGRHGARLITVVQGTSSNVGALIAASGIGPGTGRHRARARTGLGIAIRLGPALEQYALRRSDEVAVVSEAFRPVVLTAGVEPPRLHLLPNWTRVRSAGESQQSAREALGWPLDRFTVVHAAPMGPREDLRTAIEAARLLALRGETIDLLLIGDGSQRAALEQQAFGLDNVRFRDPVDDATHSLVLAAADVLLVTEAAASGGRATAGLLASYFSAGRAVVAAVHEQGATAYELCRTGGAGVRVDPGDSAALAEALLALQASPQQRGVMGRAALRYARAQLGRTGSLHRLDQIVDAALSSRRGH